MKIEAGTFFNRIPYARVGADRDPILVLSGGQAFVQRPTRERFARDARRVARLLPAGRSFVLLGYAPEGPGLDAILEDVAPVLRQLGAPSQVVGISYGGVLGLELAARQPKLVSRLVLLATAYDFSAEGKRRLADQIDCASRADFEGLVAGFLGQFRRWWWNGLVRLRLRVRRSRLGELMNDGPVIVRGLEAILDPRLADSARLGRVTAPTLVLGGSRDPFFGAGMFEGTAAAVPDAKLILFEEETHMVPVERARAVAAEVRAFLGS
jgi:pimeloyl-ACP methyl ester carboxylesterase